MHAPSAKFGEKEIKSKCEKKSRRRGIRNFVLITIRAFNDTLRRGGPDVIALASDIRRMERDAY